LANITAKPISLTVGAPLAELSPITLNTTFTVHSTGIVAGDTVTVNIASLGTYGLSVSNNTGVSNVTSKTVSLTYDGTKGALPIDHDLALSIADNINYTLTGDNYVTVIIRDGSETRRSIAVNQSNVSSFNSYANTTAGRMKHYRLMENIVLTETNWTAIGSSTAKFKGSFDGNGNTITGLNISRPTLSYQGLFGYIDNMSDYTAGEPSVTNGGIVENLGLIDCIINGNNYVGAVAGYTDSGTVRNCYVKGSATSHKISAQNAETSYVGGIAGFISMSTVENCYTNIAVEGAGDYVGGIAGSTYRGTIQFCYARGTVKGSSYTGGIVGSVSSSSLGSINFGFVKSCVALNPSLTANNSSVSNIGRVFGQGNGTANTHYSLLYARSDMTFSGVTYNPTSNVAGKDGANVSAGTSTTTTPPQYNSQTFWSTTLGWSFDINRGNWQMKDGYPILLRQQGQ